MRKHFVTLANGTKATILADDVIIGGPNSIEITLSWMERGDNVIGNAKHSRVAAMYFDSQVEDCHSENIITADTKFRLKKEWPTPLYVMPKGAVGAVKDWALRFGAPVDELVAALKKDNSSILEWLEETI